MFDIVGRCHGEQGFSRTCSPFKELFSFCSVPGRSNTESFPFGTALHCLQPRHGVEKLLPSNLKEITEVLGGKMLPL